MLNALKLKVPPLALVFSFGALMWLASAYSWAIDLSNLLTLVFLPLFVWYMDRFQILPEERVLASKFSDAFTRYKDSVRRWV
jgi:protein-S-isoprenylcysteine O-methyltransferase Ste14